MTTPTYTPEQLRSWADNEQRKSLADVLRAHAVALDDLAAAQARIAELEAALLKNGAWKIAPCCICGYNGPGYYHPDTHACAARAALGEK